MKGKRYRLDQQGQVCDDGEPMPPARVLFRLEGYERQLAEHEALLEEYRALLARANEALQSHLEDARGGAA